MSFFLLSLLSNTVNRTGPGEGVGGLAHERGGDAHPLSKGCEVRILVSVRCFRENSIMCSPYVAVKVLFRVLHKSI